MIEQTMIFALGVLTAGLLALACLPAVWARAVRLTTRRLTRLVPLSMDEIVAERDGLRAEFAVDRRRLEQKLEGVEARHASLMADLGRRDIHVAALEDEAVVRAARIALLEGELRETTLERDAVRGETGTAAVALHDLTGLCDRQRWEVQEAQEAVRSHQATIDGNRVAIASLEMRILGLDGRISDLDRALGNARAELARAEQAVGRANAERDAAAAESSRLSVHAEASQQRAAKEMQATSAHKVKIADMQIERVSLVSRLAIQAEAAMAAERALAEVEAERAALARRLTHAASGSNGSWSTTGGDLSAREHDVTRAPVSSFDGHDRSAVGPGGSAASSDAETVMLRETLRQVADAVLRMTEHRETAPDAPSSRLPASAPTIEQTRPN